MPRRAQGSKPRAPALRINMVRKNLSDFFKLAGYCRNDYRNYGNYVEHCRGDSAVEASTLFRSSHAGYELLVARNVGPCVNHNGKAYGKQNHNGKHNNGYNPVIELAGSCHKRGEQYD